MVSEATPFRNVLAYAIGGGWGGEIKDDKNDVAVSIIRGTDFTKMQNGQYGEVPSRFESASKVEKRKLQIGDIVLEVSGGSPTKGQTTGRTYLVTEETLSNLRQPVIPASFCRLVRVDVKKILPRFAYYWLQDMYSSGRAELYENQSTGISNFQFERFLDAEALKLPSLEEQRATAETLGSLDDRIANLRRVNVTLQAIAAALFKSRFVDFDGVPSENMQKSEFGVIPKGWGFSRLGNECSYLNRGISPKYIDKGGVQVLNQKCIRDFAIDTTRARRHDTAQRSVEGREVQIGDVLVNSTGVGTLGRVAQVLSIDEPTIVDSHVTIVRAGQKLNWTYLGQWFLDRQSEIEAMGEGSTGQTELSKSKLASMSIVVPDKKSLADFDAIVAPLKARIALADSSSRLLAMLRDTLLPRLISSNQQLRDAERIIGITT